MSNDFGYTESLQTKVLAMLMFSPSEFVKFVDIIEPSYFDNIVLQRIYETALEFFKRYSRVPEVDELFNEVQPYMIKRKIPEDEWTKVFEDLVMIQENETNFEYVRDKVIEFARYQAVKNAVISSAQELQKTKNYEKILKEVEKATMIGMHAEDLGIYYFENLDGRIQRRMDGNTRRHLAIPTGIGKLDSDLGGGIAPTEVGIVMSPMKRGKTQTSVVFGTGALSENKNVLHIIFEGSEDELEDLYDASISGVPVNELEDRGEEVKEKVNEFMHKTRHVGRLKIKYGSRWSPFEIEAYMHKLKALDGFEPDMIILDYLGLMVPSNKKLRIEASSGGKYFMLGEITKELLALANKYNVAIWLVHQTTRKSGTKDIINMYDSGDSIEPMRDVHLILTLNQTEAEEDPIINTDWQKMRVYVAGGRKVRSKKMTKVLINKSCCQIVEDDSDDSETSDADEDLHL